KMYSQGDLGTPTSRRFYLGGPNSHRGFSYSRLAPQVCSSSTSTMATAVACTRESSILPVPVGGDEMLLFQAEFRLNIVKIFGYWFGIAAFWDAGDVSAPSCSGTSCGSVLSQWEKTIDLSLLHHAVGGGLRYRTPIGTIRIDVGG